MPNAKLFSSTPGALNAIADTVNDAGGKAYAMSPKHALTQYAMTGTFNDTYYATAEVQLEKVLKLCAEVDNQYIAQLTVYSRIHGLMKDVPAFLLAYLSTTDYPKLPELFKIVITNGKMLRNYVQIIRSGITGRKSLGTKLRRLVRDWLINASDHTILNASIGNDPSLADVIKMVHPKPADENRAALFAWLINKEANIGKLPVGLQEYLSFIAASEDLRMEAKLPEVPFLMLSSTTLNSKQWMEMAIGMTWTQLRMNLNTFQRNGVFQNPAVAQMIADRLGNKDEVISARAFPYQIMTTYMAVKGVVPNVISDALHDALEHSLVNVPEITGNAAILIDVSGSMSSTKVMKARNGNVANPTNCIDVASLIACAIMRKNPNKCLPLAFDTQVYDLQKLLEMRDSVLTNASKLASIRGGGTDCSLPLQALLQISETNNIAFDTVIMISDNESWVTGKRAFTRGTGAEAAWNAYKAKHPNSKLICLDIVPNNTTQVKERAGVTNIGGFSDNVFKLIGQVTNGEADANHMVNEVEKVVL